MGYVETGIVNFGVRSDAEVIDMCQYTLNLTSPNHLSARQATARLALEVGDRSLCLLQLLSALDPTLNPLLFGLMGLRGPLPCALPPRFTTPPPPRSELLTTLASGPRLPLEGAFILAPLRSTVGVREEEAWWKGFIWGKGSVVERRCGGAGWKPEDLERAKSCVDSTLRDSGRRTRRAADAGARDARDRLQSSCGR